LAKADWETYPEKHNAGSHARKAHDARTRDGSADAERLFDPAKHKQSRARVVSLWWFLSALSGEILSHDRTG